MWRSGRGSHPLRRRERTRHEKITINGVGLWVGLRSEKPNLKPKGEKEKENEKRKKWVWTLGRVKDWP